MSRLVSLVLLAGLSTPAFAASFTVDPIHTRVGFAVGHMMVTTVRGEFGGVSGSVEFDPTNLPATKVTAEIDANSVDTRYADRDTHLKSPDFFDVATSPSLKFVSKSVKNVGKDGSFELVGDLTIRGITKEVTLKVAPFSAEYKDPWGNVKVGTRAVGVVNRKDFGMVWNKSLDSGGYLVGEEVQIELDVELKKN